MRKKDYKDVTVSYEMWKAIMQLKLNLHKRSAGATLERSLEYTMPRKWLTKRHRIL